MYKTVDYILQFLHCSLGDVRSLVDCSLTYQLLLVSWKSIGVSSIQTLWICKFRIWNYCQSLVLNFHMNLKKPLFTLRPWTKKLHWIRPQDHRDLQEKGYLKFWKLINSFILFISAGNPVQDSQMIVLDNGQLVNRVLQRRLSVNNVLLTADFNDIRGANIWNIGLKQWNGYECNNMNLWENIDRL